MPLKLSLDNSYPSSEVKVTAPKGVVFILVIIAFIVSFGALGLSIYNTFFENSSNNVTTSNLSKFISEDPTVEKNTKKKSVYPSVDVATTEEVTLEDSVPEKIDGVETSNGMKVLIQFNDTDNGIYQVINGKFTVASELSEADQIVDGGMIYIKKGTTYGNQTVQLIQSNSDKVIAGYSMSFVSLAKSALPSAPTTLSALVSTSEEFKWSNTVAVMDEFKTTDTILTRKDAANVEESQIVITDKTNIEGVKNLVFKAANNNSLTLAPNNNTTKMKLNFPSDLPTAGLALLVQTVDNLTNTVDLTWNEASIGSVAQLVIVSKNPLGGQFNSVIAAIASITDASVNKPYVVIIEPGIYNEDNIVLSDNISLRGKSEEACVINGGSMNNVIYLANNTVLSSLTITSNQTSGSGLFGIVLQNKANVLVDSITVTSASCLSIVTTTQNTSIDIHNIRFLNGLDNGIISVNASVFTQKVSISSCKFEFQIVGTPIGLECNGANTFCIVQSSIFTGKDAISGTCFICSDGADLKTIGCSISDFNFGFNVPVGTGNPNLEISSTLFHNTTTQVQVLDTDCVGYIESFVDVSKTNIVKTSSFFIVDQPDNYITVDQKGADFKTINAAVNYITSLTGGREPSISNRYIIALGSGNFSEANFILPSFVSIQGRQTDSSTITQTDTNSVFITTSQYSTIQNCSINVGTGTSTGILYEGGQPIAAGLTLTNVNISGQDFTSVLVLLNSNFGSQVSGLCANFTTMNNIKFFGQFSIGIDLNNTLGFNVSLLLDNFEWLNPSSIPLTVDVVTFRTRGVESTVYPLGANSVVIVGTNFKINDSRGEAQEAKSIGFKCETFANIGLVGGNLGQLKSGIEMLNNGLQILRVRGTLFANVNTAVATTKIQIDNTTTFGFINGIVDTQFVTIASPDIFLNTIDPDSGATTITGAIFVGDAIDNVTNMTESFTSSTSVGILSGGDVTIPTQPSLTGISIASGSGYVINNSQPKFISWTSPLVSGSIGANDTYYLYIDSTTNLITNQTTLPSNTSEFILLGRLHTDATSIIYFQDLRVNIQQLSSKTNIINKNVYGGIFGQGAIVTVNGTVQLDVTSGTYYYGTSIYQVVGGTAVSFRPIYNTGNTILAASTSINITQYDNSGTLTNLPSSEYARHAFYVVNGGPHEEYLFVFATATNITKTDAPLPNLPPYFGENITLLSAIIVQQGVANIESIEDLRPRPNFTQTAISGGASPTDHQSLTNRADPGAHSQYLQKGGDTMTGVLNMGAQSITDVTTITDQSAQPITLSTISTRLIPGGLDALPTGTPVDISIANNPGGNNTFSRSDHIHAHGNLAGGSLHAVVNGSTNGFMLSTDKTKLDSSTSTPTASTIVEWDTNSNLKGNNFITQNAGELQLANNTSSFFVSLKAAGSLAQNVAFQLPISFGTAGQFMQSDGAGALTFATPVTGTTSIFQVRTASIINTNSAVPTPVDWTVTPDFIDSQYTLESGLTNIKINATGRYEIYVNLVVTSTVARTAVKIKIRKNGTDLPGTAITPAIDAKSGQNTASTSFQMTYSLTINDLISITVQQDGAAGTISLIPNQSVLKIQTI